MSSPRALANHARYMASLQLSAWREAAACEDKPAWVLAAAFAPAVRLHLCHAYGWLLLTAARESQAPTTPPHSVEDLPTSLPGLARSAVLDHCRDLEHRGWVGVLLAPIPAAAPVKPQSGVLASSGAMPELDTCRDWCAAWDELMALVDESIEER